MPLSTLIHIRHGQTEWNATARLQGSQDIPLNALGREQALRNGRALKDELQRLGRHAEELHFIGSPLGRARDTMELVRGELGLPVGGYEVEPRLIEVSFGDFEGLSYADVEKRDPEAYAALRADKWHFVPPGGESYVMLRDRVARWHATLDRDVIVISHGGVYRALRSVLYAIHDPTLADYFVPQDRIFVWRDGAGRWV